MVRECELLGRLPSTDRAFLCDAPEWGLLGRLSVGTDNSLYVNLFIEREFGLLVLLPSTVSLLLCDVSESALLG